MLKNYFKIAFRTLRRHRAYALINITGLAVGMACALLIFLYVQDELSFDDYHVNKDRLYRLAQSQEDASFEGIAKVPGPWGPAVQERVPEVQAFVRFRFFGQTLVSRGEARFYESGAFTVDPEVFEVFSYRLLRGDPQTALEAPNSVVLTQTLARKYFGEEDALGQTLSFDGEQEMTVTGVMEDVPPASHFTFPFLVSRSTEQDSLQYSWIRQQYYTYLLLADGATPAAVEAKIPEVLRAHLDAETADAYTPFLQPITSIHLHSHLFREMEPNANVAYIYIFSAVAFFILLLACINFMNLATARSARRAREVGVRKASGARRGALIGQFLGESLLMSGIALALALALVSAFLPAFNTLTGKTLETDLLASAPFVLGMIALALVVGVLSGSYPAFVLSAYKPADVLKGGAQGGGHARLRRALVVFQFAISAFLIIAVGIVGSQLRFIQERDLGFNQDQLVTVPIRDQAMVEVREAFKQELLKQPGVQRVAVSGNLPGGGDYGFPLYPEGIPDDERPTPRILVVDHDFIDTYQMEIVAGRNFTDGGADAAGAFLLNEEALRQIGWEDPIGKMIGLPESISAEPLPVVGIVKDFHFRSLHEEIGPLVFFRPPPNWYGVFTLRLGPDRLEETLAAVEGVWATFEPTHPFTYQFLDEQFAALYRNEQRVSLLLNYATALALLIACLGLFGLAAFTAEQRTKEIGIRKALGATVGGIVLLLSKDFARLVLLAFVVAAPLAYLAMNRWLEDFAYRATPSVWLFLGAGLAALGIALLTVSYQALRAALADPVKALRHE